MKPISSLLAAALGLAALAPTLPAAESAQPARVEKRELRVITGPERAPRPFLPSGERRSSREMEKVAFLGVEVSPVPPALGSQLALARGTGLVVGQVAPKSPADGVLQEHDILLRLDDQILIEPRQLAVLVRNHREGEEVEITYLRGGQKASIRVKLGVHEVPKYSGVEAPGPAVPLLPFGQRPGIVSSRPNGEPQRVEVDRLLSLLGRPRPGEPVRVEIERRDGPGLRAMSVNPGNSNLVYRDDEGSLDLVIKDGGKMLVAKDATGEQLFAGPVTTPEERQALPARLRERLEQLEAMRDVSFKTDGDFEGAETRTLQPLGRRIGWPQPHVAPAAPAGAI